jgi:hypothetical protein
MNGLRDHFRKMPTSWWLSVIRRRSRVDAIAPDIRAKLGERESRLRCHKPHAHGGTGFSLSGRTEIEVIDARSDSFSKDLAFRRARVQEVISKIHGATVGLVVRSLIIDQNDLLSQSFSLVYHFDVRA